MGPGEPAGPDAAACERERGASALDGAERDEAPGPDLIEVAHRETGSGPGQAVAGTGLIIRVVATLAEAVINAPAGGRPAQNREGKPT